MIIDLFKKINLHHTIYWRDIKFKTTSSFEHQGWIGAGFKLKVSQAGRAGGPVVVAGVVWWYSGILYSIQYTVYTGCLSSCLVQVGFFEQLEACLQDLNILLRLHDWLLYAIWYSNGVGTCSVITSVLREKIM